MEKNNPLFKRIKEYTDHNYDMPRMESTLWDEFGAVRACLVLDSTGFTRVTKEKGITYFLHLIVKMRGIALEVVNNNNSTGFRSEADNIYAEFLTVDDAVKASFQLHEAVYNADLYLNEKERFKVCIGIGYGKLLLAGDDGVFGDEMNISSKLGEDTAEGGETLLSENAFKNFSFVDQVKCEDRNITASSVPINYYAISEH
jgi:class 3 adenylate cyclase